MYERSSSMLGLAASVPSAEKAGEKAADKKDPADAIGGLLQSDGRSHSGDHDRYGDPDSREAIGVGNGRL